MSKSRRLTLTFFPTIFFIHSFQNEHRMERHSAPHPQIAHSHPPAEQLTYSSATQLKSKSKGADMYLASMEPTEPPPSFASGNLKM